MGSTIAEMATKVGNAVKGYPINPDSGYSTRMTARCTEAYAHICYNFKFWWDRDSTTFPPAGGVMPDIFEQMFQALSMYGALMDYGLVNTAMTFWNSYNALAGQFLSFLPQSPKGGS
jgi:hypothetical protein